MCSEVCYMCSEVCDMCSEVCDMCSEVREMWMKVCDPSLCSDVWVESEAGTQIGAGTLSRAWGVVALAFA